jgi:hypothetical protein
MATLRTMVAIPTASIVKGRLGSNGMRHHLGGSRAAALIWIKPAFSVAGAVSGAGAGRLDARTVGRGQDIAAAIAG